MRASQEQNAIGRERLHGLAGFGSVFVLFLTLAAIYVPSLWAGEIEYSIVIYGSLSGSITGDIFVDQATGDILPDGSLSYNGFDGSLFGDLGPVVGISPFEFRDTLDVTTDILMPQNAGDTAYTIEELDKVTQVATPGLATEVDTVPEPGTAVLISIPLLGLLSVGLWQGIRYRNHLSQCAAR